MRKIQNKRRPFKTTEEYLAHLDRDIARWRVVDGNVDIDRLFATGFDALFAEFGIPCQIGDAQPHSELLRLREEALAKNDQSLALLLAECLRVINAASRAIPLKPTWGRT